MKSFTSTAAPTPGNDPRTTRKNRGKTARLPQGSNGSVQLRTHKGDGSEVTNAGQRAWCLAWSQEPPMVIRNLLWSFAVLGALCSACSSDPGAGDHYIDLPEVTPVSHTGSSSSNGGGSSSGGSSGAASTAGGMSGIDAVLPSAG